MNVSQARDSKAVELVVRAEASRRDADALAFLATAVERLVLPVCGYEDARTTVVARLRRDAFDCQREVARLMERVVDIRAAEDAATAWTRRRP